MGCGPSKPTQPDMLVETVRPPTRPRPPRDPDSNQVVDTELSRQTLLAGLSSVAAWLQSQHIETTIIIVGDAISTLFIRNRQTTRAIDFFNDNMENNELWMVQAAGRDAQDDVPNLPDDWLTDRTTLSIRPELRKELTQEAMKQKEIIFEAPSLLVLAAPHMYGLCVMLDRLSETPENGSNGGRDDLTDAVAYLLRYLTIKETELLARSEVSKFARQYRTNIATGVLDRVDAEFTKSHGRSPFLLID